MLTAVALTAVSWKSIVPAPYASQKMVVRVLKELNPVPECRQKMEGLKYWVYSAVPESDGSLCLSLALAAESCMEAKRDTRTTSACQCIQHRCSPLFLVCLSRNGSSLSVQVGEATCLYFFAWCVILLSAGR